MDCDGEVVARVLPDVRGLAKTFDYLVPDRLRDQVRVGALVRVPLGGRRVGGWVVALGGEAPPGVDLKPIATPPTWPGRPRPPAGPSP